MNDFWITPFSKRSEFSKSLSFEDKVRIFSEQVDGWILSPALEVVSLKVEGSFAALALVISYFEMVGEYKFGKEKSGENFELGFKDVFGDGPNRENSLKANKLMWKDVRNGLYHAMVTGSGIWLDHKFQVAIKYVAKAKEPEHVEINAKYFIYEVRKHFQKYILELSNKENLKIREQFVKKFESDRKVKK